MPFGPVILGNRSCVRATRRFYISDTSEHKVDFTFVGGRGENHHNLPFSPSQEVRLSDRERWLLQCDLYEIRDLLKSGRVTSSELCEGSLKQNFRMGFFNAFISVKSKTNIMKEAQSFDSNRPSRSILGGIPIAVKDNFAVKDMPTTCASRILKDFIAPYNSTVSSRLEEAGGIIIGKTNLDEFGMGSTTTNSIFGPTINPWSQVLFERTKNAKESILSPGGSSGGSAVAVASRCVWAATATDTGGSSRLPASLTGVIGYKPTYGYSSRYGVVQYASSLDCPALITRSVRDVDLLRQIIAGWDPLDSTSVQLPKIFYQNYEEELGQKASRPFVIGIPCEYNIFELSDNIKEIWLNAIHYLKKEHNCKIVNVSLPHTPKALIAYHVIASAEAFSNLCRYDGIRFGTRENGSTVEEVYTNTRNAGFGKKVLTRIILGTFVLSHSAHESFYEKALKIRNLITKDFENIFQAGIDAVLTPVNTIGSMPLFKIQKMMPKEYYQTDIMTVSANLAKIPAISVPFQLDENGLPQGVQLMGPAFEDAKLIRIAQLLERNWLQLQSQNEPNSPNNLLKYILL